MKTRASTRRDLITNQDTRKVATRRRAIQKRDTSMRTTKDTRTNTAMSRTTHITRSTGRRAESTVVVSMALSMEDMEEEVEVEEVMEEVMVEVTTSGFRSLNIKLKEALLCLLSFFLLLLTQHR